MNNNDIEATANRVAERLWHVHGSTRQAEGDRETIIAYRHEVESIIAAELRALADDRPSRVWLCSECGGTLVEAYSALNEHAQGCKADDWPLQDGVPQTGERWDRLQAVDMGIVTEQSDPPQKTLEQLEAAIDRFTEACGGVVPELERDPAAPGDADLSPEQIAAEFNRRRWQNCDNWFASRSGGVYTLVRHLQHDDETGEDYEGKECVGLSVDAETAGSLVAGWKAMDELAELRKEHQKAYAAMGLGDPEEQWEYGPLSLCCEQIASKYNDAASQVASLAAELAELREKLKRAEWDRDQLLEGRESYVPQCTAAWNRRDG